MSEPDRFDHDDPTDTQPSDIRVRRPTMGEEALAVLEAVPLPAWIFDGGSGQIAAVNGALLDLTRRTRESLTGALVLELHEPSERPAIALQLHQLGAQSAPGERHELAPTRLLVRGGRPVRVKVTTRALAGAKPGARLAIAEALPATAEPPAIAKEPPAAAETRPASADDGPVITVEPRELDRLGTELVSVVSHELRTPLTALRGSLGLLTGGVLGPLPGDVMELLHIAERNSLRLISLVNDILDLERLEQGKVELFIEPVRARAIIERSIDSVKAFADEDRVRIGVACGAEGVLGDGDRLVQVLVNLLSNAVKFSPPDGRVEVWTEVEPEAVVFRVRDEGRGIPASYHALIFERFEQVPAPDQRERRGTGLGLAISKAIVMEHGGAIGVDSEEGKGSTFWFRVPRA
jgi:signal transduction histidine kinase